MAENIEIDIMNDNIRIDVDERGSVPSLQVNDSVSDATASKLKKTTRRDEVVDRAGYDTAAKDRDQEDIDIVDLDEPQSKSKQDY